MRETSARSSARSSNTPASASASDSASTPLAYQRAPSRLPRDTARDHVHHTAHRRSRQTAGPRPSPESAPQACLRCATSAAPRRSAPLPAGSLSASRAIPRARRTAPRAVSSTAGPAHRRRSQTVCSGCVRSAFSMVAASSATFFTGTIRPNQPTVSGPRPAGWTQARNSHPDPARAARPETCAGGRCETCPLNSVACCGDTTHSASVKRASNCSMRRNTPAVNAREILVQAIAVKRVDDDRHAAQHGRQASQATRHGGMRVHDRRAARAAAAATSATAPSGCAMAARNATAPAPSAPGRRRAAGSACLRRPARSFPPPARCDTPCAAISRVSSSVWIAGPPIFSRVMTRTTLGRSGPAVKSRTGTSRSPSVECDRYIQTPDGCPAPPGRGGCLRAPADLRR